jgi:membrane-bound lytic murein transglycosylase D
MFGQPRSEACTVSVVETVDPLLARLVRLTPKGQCTGFYVPKNEIPEAELCLFEGLGAIEYADLNFNFDEFDGPIPVSVELESYILNKRATKYVERNIRILSEDIRERFAHWLARSGRYTRMMQNILREEGLPKDMVWLSLIESGFNTRAYSRSHAAGPWQFIKATGRRYGLKVDYWVDERRDPVKSTRAAARYLKDLYKMFDSWSLAMAAYNAGEGRIKRALKRTGSNDFWSLLRTRHIRNETKNYVPKFIAARMIAVEPEKYGIFNIKYHDDFTYDEVVINAPISLDIAARCAGTTTQAMKDLNPELRRWSTPPVKKYTLRVPRGTREKFMAELDKLPRRKWVTAKVYTVKRGDTLSHISKRYGVSIRSIRDYNRINRRGLIRPGQKIIIPISLRRS